MATVSLLDLIAVESREDITEEHVALLAAQGFPVTAWQSGNAGRTLVETADELIAHAGKLVALIAAGGYRSTAVGSWLTLLGEDTYDEPRKEAAEARHRVRLTDEASVGPIVYAIGDFVALGPGKLEFHLATGGTLPLDGTVDLEVVAAGDGPAYNAPVGTITSFAVDQPGVGITNPDLDDGTNSSLLALGADEETDADYAARLPLKWDAQGAAGNVGAWQYHALKSDVQVRKALVLEHTPDEGDVTVYLAGSSGPVPSLALSDATTYLDENARPLGTRLYVLNASALSVPVVATVTVTPGLRGKAEAEVVTNLADYQTRLPFGSAVVRSQVIEEIMSAEGVTNVSLVHPVADVTPAVGQLPVFALTLTYVEV